MDRGAWWAIVHRVVKNQTQLSVHTNVHTHTHTHTHPHTHTHTHGPEYGLLMHCEDTSWFAEGMVPMSWLPKLSI